jgi:hypothetical protein
LVGGVSCWDLDWRSGCGHDESGHGKYAQYFTIPEGKPGTLFAVYHAELWAVVYVVWLYEPASVVCSEFRGTVAIFVKKR